MSISSRNLHEDTTHWPYTGPDTYGGFVFGTAVLFKGRWEGADKLSEESTTREELSDAVVYVPVDVQIGDYLAEGDLTAQGDPTIIDGAWKVRDYNRMTDLRKLNTIRKAML